MTVLAARTSRDVLTVEGDDAVSYLQGQLSQDVERLAVGEATWSFVLAPQGKVDGWGRVQRVAGDGFRIDVDPGAGSAWEARLRRFLMRTKAEIALEEGVDTLAVRGVEVPGALPAGWPGVVGSDVVGIDGHGMPDGVPADVVLVDEDDLEPMRISAGVPRWGAELDAETIPATVGQWVIDASVSFTKGCYTGQELVARIDSRGGNVPRRLVGLRIDGPAPAPGSPVTVDGAAAGTVTSSADLPGGGSVALAFVPRATEVPADGEVAGEVAGAAARLVTLPMTR
jgi:folate-binding protein YgfZ